MHKRRETFFTLPHTGWWPCKHTSKHKRDIRKPSTSVINETGPTCSRVVRCRTQQHRYLVSFQFHVQPLVLQVLHLM